MLKISIGLVVFGALCVLGSKTGPAIVFFGLALCCALKERWDMNETFQKA